MWVLFEIRCTARLIRIGSLQSNQLKTAFQLLAYYSIIALEPAEAIYPNQYFLYGQPMLLLSPRLYNI
jgi:hypothetical protein